MILKLELLRDKLELIEKIEDLENSKNENSNEFFFG
jgi:hypothetical protein